MHPDHTRQPADKILEIAAHYGCFIAGPPINI